MTLYSTLRTTVLGAAVSLSLVALADGKAHAGDAAKPILVKVATVAPKGTPWSALMDRVKNRVKKATAGHYKMKVYYGGRLGGEKETVTEVRAGRLQMWGGSTAAMATIVPELYALETPFLFESSAEADFVIDKFARPHVEKLLAQKDFVLYEFSENGWHGIATKSKCIKSPADLSGLKIRSQEATVHLDMFRSMGANPIEMAVPEVLPALKQGVVDGFSNTPLFAFAVSWYQGVKHFTVSNHVYQPAVVVYSKKWFDKQPKDMQKILMQGVAEDEKFGREGVRSIQPGLLDNFRKSGIEVCELTPAERAVFQKKTSGIFGTYMKKSTKAGKALYQSILDGKKAWAKQKKG